MDAAHALNSITEIYKALHVLSTLNLTAFQCPEQAVVKDGAVYDFVIIGASGAGSIIASRLTENSNTRVLLVEAGGCPPFETWLPILLAFVLRPDNLWNYKSKVDKNTQSFLQEKVSKLRMGKMLGGSSEINLYTYLRGDPHDYDAWAKSINDDSWSYDNILQFFIKSEKLNDTEISQSFFKDYHGYDGYIGVTRQRYPQADRYLNAFKEKHRIVMDFNRIHANGYMRPLLTLLDGMRQGPTASILAPIMDRRNLDILTHHTAVNIEFDKNKKGTGVKIMDKNGKTIKVKANKEVIVTAGAVNTAKLLMLSGIGPKKHLKSRNIRVLSDLPVGQNNLINHPYVTLLYVTDKSSPLKLRDPRMFTDAYIIGRAALNKSQTFADYQTINYIEPNRDIMLYYCLAYFTLEKTISQHFYDQAKDREVMFTLIAPLRPKSRGCVKLKSSNPQDAPVIINGLMSNKRDVEDMIKYIKDFDRISYSTFFKSVKSKLLKVPNNCKKGDEYWKCYVKGSVTSNGELSGTCPMGKVVDKDLKVHGVTSLRVADESVVPTPVGGTTYITSVMIGERASEKIKNTHCIS